MTDEQALPQATGQPALIAGRYELERSLGSGGMGEVFAATDRTLDREVALKRLPVALSDDPDARTRFFREAQALARINDRHVVPVYDAGDDEGRPYLVMQLVDGATLADELRVRGSFSAERSAAIGADIAAGLAAAHANGVVHRDVKPSNIFLAPDDHAMIGDFGIARVQRGDMTLTMTGQAFGSPPYIAPEQATGGQVDARADIYSLGCVLYHMLSGHPPFEGDESVALTYQHVHTVPPALDETGVAVSPELSALVASMLRKDPAARPKSADAVRLALETRPAGGDSVPPPPVVGGPGPGDRTKVMPQRVSRAASERRTRAWVWPVVAAALVIALIVGIALARGGGDPAAGARGARSPHASSAASSPPASSAPAPSQVSTGPAPTTPQQAAAVVLGLARSLSSSGDISPDLATQIRSGVADALDHADEPDEVNKTIHDLQKTIDDAVKSGSATSGAASQLDPALGLLGDLLHHGNGNQGEGNGNGNGQD
jgi:eukaryotic-like serine/threonine-protein kinase